MDEFKIPVNCPSCGSERTIKDGSYRGTPRRHCKECGRRYSGRTGGASERTKRFAVHLYLEGLGLSSIGRVPNRSPACILYWVRNASKNLLNGKITSDMPGSIPVIEMDEMWHFIKKKRKNCGYGLLLTDTEGDRSLLFAGEGVGNHVKGFSTK